MKRHIAGQTTLEGEADFGKKLPNDVARFIVAEKILFLLL
jgi:hypothetical protein